MLLFVFWAVVTGAIVFVGGLCWVVDAADDPADAARAVLFAPVWPLWMAYFVLYACWHVPGVLGRGARRLIKDAKVEELVPPSIRAKLPATREAGQLSTTTSDHPDDHP